jgi:hypothetical protein
MLTIFRADTVAIEAENLCITMCTRLPRGKALWRVINAGSVPWSMDDGYADRSGTPSLEAVAR